MTLVSDSWTTRYAVSDTAASGSLDRPGPVQLDVEPRSAYVVDQSGRCRRGPGSGGRVPSSVVSRSMPSIDRVCSSALRLVSAMTSRLCSAASGSVRITCAPTPACTAISDMLCATTSCRSRAMRSRSSVTAATSCSRWYCRRHRIASPTAQAATSNASDWSRTDVPRSGTSSNASPTKHSNPDPEADQRVTTPAVGGQRVQAEQHQHREQADVVPGQGHHEAAGDHDGVRRRRPAPPPGQRPGGRHSGDRRDDVRILEPRVDRAEVRGEERGQRQRRGHDPDGGIEVRRQAPRRLGPARLRPHVRRLRSRNGG